MQIANIDANGTGMHGGSWGRTKVFFKPGYGKPTATRSQEMLPAVEWIASRLALALGLPTPTGQIGELSDGRKVWVSMVVQLGSELPAPPDPQEVVAKEPNLAAGTLVFDTWIYNNDRHDENVLFHKKLGLWLIDHDQALSGPSMTNTIEGLPRYEARPLTEHIFRDLVAKEHTDQWVRRVRAFPVSVVRGIINSGYRSGLYSKEYGRGVLDFLKVRQRNLADLVVRSQTTSDDTNDVPVPAGQTALDIGGGGRA